MINIQSTNNLSKAQIDRIRVLEQTCNAFDNTNGELWLSNDFNQHEDMPCFFLLSEKQTLQGVMTIFAPMSEPAEISALVLPECRRNGHFRAMLCAAKAQLTKLQLRDIFFVHESKSAAGKQMIARWNIAPHHSEYLLGYDKQHAFEADKKTNIQLKSATEEDLDELLKINADVFDRSEEGFVGMLRKSIASEKTQCFKAMSGGRTIGVCNANHTDEGLYICGFGISPAY